MSVVISELKNNVCTLIINRPNQLNALNEDVLNDLKNNIEQLKGTKNEPKIILKEAKSDMKKGTGNDAKSELKKVNQKGKQNGRGVFAKKGFSKSELKRGI